jgi:recombinational DNA repair protein (RecF pathway)
MHAIHTTPGFIIDSRPSGEAGKLISIFTRDYGLVFASAQGIRLEKSKLRYHAQEYSFGVFSLVRGKEYWRLTSAQGSSGQASSELIARLALLLRRLLHGEEPHPELFMIIESCSRFLRENESVSDEQLKSLESLIVLRVLRALGYIGNDAGLSDIASSFDLSLGLLDALNEKRASMNQHINKALRESHL